MSVRTYELEEKLELLAKYHASEQSPFSFSKENDIPESTFRGWLKEEQELSFGAIDLNTQKPKVPKEVRKSMIFACENIRVELKEGFDKQLLKQIMEVLINAR